MIFGIYTMNELKFFKKLFPKTNKFLNINEFYFEDGYQFNPSIDYWDKPRTEEEGPVCECVGENTNKDLFLYFQSIIKQGVQLPVYINGKNQVMDGWHRLHAYYYMGETKVPVYINKVTRNHGFCWKKGIEGKRRLRLKTW